MIGGDKGVMDKLTWRRFLELRDDRTFILSKIEGRVEAWMRTSGLSLPIMIINREKAVLGYTIYGAKSHFVVNHGMQLKPSA